MEHLNVKDFLHRFGVNLRYVFWCILHIFLCIDRLFWFVRATFFIGDENGNIEQGCQSRGSNRSRERERERETHLLIVLQPSHEPISFLTTCQPTAAL
jgi:hypothetical protein